jgi:hypothetical protein
MSEQTTQDRVDTAIRIMGQRVGHIARRSERDGATNDEALVLGAYVQAVAQYQIAGILMWAKDSIGHFFESGMLNAIMKMGMQGGMASGVSTPPFVETPDGEKPGDPDAPPSWVDDVIKKETP